jgi:hypothetical protein
VEPGEASKPEATTGSIAEPEPNKHEKHKVKKAAAPAEASQSPADQFPGINR